MIGLEQVTDGPRVLVTYGGGSSGRAVWAEVAEHLEGMFACWLADRRGKGASGDTKPYSFEREYDDVAAVSEHFGEEVVLAAHSSGAVCLLGAAARGVRAGALVLYEPPWPLEGRPPSADALDAMDAHLAAGEPEKALLVGSRRLVGLSEEVIRGLQAAPGWTEQVALVHTWSREARELDRMPPGTASLRGIETPALLLGGELSPRQHHLATAALAAALPNATVVELGGQRHGALQTAPGLIAEAIRDVVGRQG